MYLHPKVGGNTGDLASPRCLFRYGPATQRPRSLRRKPRSAISSWLIRRDQHSYLQPEKTISTNLKPALTHLLLFCIVTRADREEPQV